MIKRMRVFVDDKHFMAENPMPHKYAMVLTEKINEIIDYLNQTDKKIKSTTVTRSGDEESKAESLRKEESGVTKSIVNKPGRKKNVR